MSDETRQPDASDPKRRTIDKLHLVNFTAFKDLEIEFSPGINAIIGENATGKTHMMKVMYFLLKTGGSLRGKDIDNDLSAYFFATYIDQWNLINRDAKPRTAKVILASGNEVIPYDISDVGKLKDDLGDDSGHQTNSGVARHYSENVESCFIPAKEIISHKKHFIATWERREIYFEKQYKDILSNTELGGLKVLPSIPADILRRIEVIIGGPVAEYSDVYHIVQNGFKLELSLVAEGLRKFALLWLLVRNGSIAPESILFWDEPEANLNPKLIGEAVELILMMQRMGVQVFIATHSYLVLKELELRANAEDKVMFHSLYRDEAGDIKCNSTNEFALIEPNDILDVYSGIYERVVDRVVNGGKHEG